MTEEESELRPGIERSYDFEVDERLMTDVGGTIGRGVLSTPGMIAMMERNAAMLVFPLLPDGSASVGFEVCIKHVGGAEWGAACTAHARLEEVVEERKLRFAVEVREGDRVIGTGTHERRVIEVGPPAEGDEIDDEPAIPER